MGIEAPIPISTKSGDLNSIFLRIVSAAKHPHSSIPKTEAGRSRKQFQRLINRSLMVFSGMLCWSFGFIEVLESVGCLFLMDDHFCCGNRARVLLLFELIASKSCCTFWQLELRWQLLDWQQKVEWFPLTVKGWKFEHQSA
jgi:hypothetical protein